MVSSAGAFGGVCRAEDGSRESSSDASSFQRSSSDRKRRREWAKLSADRAIIRLSEEVVRLRGQCERFREAIEALFGDPEFSDRVLALAPALLDLLHSRGKSKLSVLRRNVALHADAAGRTVADASEGDLKFMQKGCRLESRARNSSTSCFSPSIIFPGAWEPCVVDSVETFMGDPEPQ
eukprot:6767514-Pyramimonas_sp.AAC.1